MFGSLDPAKLLLILVLGLVVLGPERLPRYARQAGAMWRELTKVRDQVTEELRSALPDVDLPKIPRMPTNMVSGFISDITKPSVSSAGGASSSGETIESTVEDPSGELASASTTGSGTSDLAHSDGGSSSDGGEASEDPPGWVSPSSTRGHVMPADRWRPPEPARVAAAQDYGVTLDDAMLSFDDASMN